MERDTTTIKELLAKGAEVNAKNGGGTTAMSVAKMAKHTEIVRLLKEAGAQE